MTDEDTILVLRFLIKHELADSMFYGEDGGKIWIAENCNDLFGWACADMEDINVNRLPVFERAIVDCENVYEGGTAYAGTLYAARIRKMRPQTACYVNYPKELWPLLDATGPEREVNFGNPYTRKQAESEWDKKAPPIWKKSPKS